MAAPPIHSGVDVDLPNGGKLTLYTSEEAQLWDDLDKRYRADYALNNINDLMALGMILTHNITIFRAQQAMNGMEAEFDTNGRPTGRYVQAKLKASEQTAVHQRLLKAGNEIRELEKSLGIDKKTREAGGGDSVAEYIETLKLAGRQFGVHIARRTKAYEEFCMELRWRIRVLHNGDEEDRAHHNVTAESILQFAERHLAELEAIDQEFAKRRGKIFVGKL